MQSQIIEIKHLKGTLMVEDASVKVTTLSLLKDGIELGAFPVTQNDKIFESDIVIDKSWPNGIYEFAWNAQVAGKDTQIKEEKFVNTGYDESLPRELQGLG